MKITAAPSPRGKKMSCSGKDWSERTKRLAARTPNLSIFSQGLVERLAYHQGGPPRLGNHGTPIAPSIGHGA